MRTEQSYLEDSYLSTLEARLLVREGERGLVFDRTNFFAAGGGQPGDTGSIECADGRSIAIVDTRKGEQGDTVVMIAADDAALPEPGESVVLHLDWARRYRLMRMHTACHLLTVVLPYPVTGAAVGETESRIDFDLPGVEIDKETATRALMALVAANHPIATRWIDADALDKNPGLLKSKNVRPPRGAGRIRLVTIGSDGEVDGQPCGGTHVGETAEVGEIHIGKIEKKGRENRRFRIRFGAPPER